MCTTPADSLPETIRQFNVRFTTEFKPDADYSQITLMNLMTYCEQEGEVHLARMFSRHADNAKELI